MTDEDRCLLQANILAKSVAMLGRTERPFDTACTSFRHCAANRYTCIDDDDADGSHWICSIKICQSDSEPVVDNSPAKSAASSFCMSCGYASSLKAHSF